jgi:small subunit ribosomal protein S16
MIKIRLQRHGARHAPFYRMVVAPAQSRRDGRFIEVLGTYNPQSSSRERELDLKMDRVDHWLEVGAQPTDTAKSLIRQGRLSPEDWLKRAESKASAKTARAAKKKNPAPVVEEVPAEAPADETAEEPKAEEAPTPEAKEEAPVEEKAPEPEAKEEASKAKAEEVKEDKAEESAEEAKPEPEAKAEDKAGEKEGEES